MTRRSGYVLLIVGVRVFYGDNFRRDHLSPRTPLSLRPAAPRSPSRRARSPDRRTSTLRARPRVRGRPWEGPTGRNGRPRRRCCRHHRPPARCRLRQRRVSAILRALRLRLHRELLPLHTIRQLQDRLVVEVVLVAHVEVRARAVRCGHRRLARPRHLPVHVLVLVLIAVRDENGRPPVRREDPFACEGRRGVGRSRARVGEVVRAGVRRRRSSGGPCGWLWRRGTVRSTGDFTSSGLAGIVVVV
ncbi:uncharacterized protein B0H18DRAFT_1033191 [Fomitopsis serialis]|uniref:uncharacterized protein n=1 Tax=Fomitopsis serialis TaxID=139415 RepID=UPI002008E96E|nr:uncharacterized protein B0H18DRAFT_1033191 [Neoantrodia serialis]KAH9917824.1 hypothetical protein B0H18DRAFT_1033191 [Neoantrodia serialis]